MLRRGWAEFPRQETSISSRTAKGPRRKRFDISGLSVGDASCRSWAELKRRHHMRDRIVERHIAVEIRLPESLEQFEILVPATLKKPLAHRVRRIFPVRVAREALHQRLDDFAGRIEHKRVPQIARNRFVALATLPIYRQLHWFRDAVRRFMKQHLEGRAALIARIGA